MKKDHITQLSEALRNIEELAALAGLPNTALSSTLAGNAAKELEDYKESVGQFVPRLPPHLR